MSQRVAPILALLFVGCAWMSGAGPRQGCPVTPVSSRALPEGLSLRARMIFEVDERRVGVEVVARREADELVVVGLANFGVRLFTLRQRGREISIADTPSRERRHLALWVLDALHRVRWIRPPGGAGREAESLRWDWYGERVTEQRRDGHVRREFVRIDGDSVSPVVAIEYSSSDAGNVEIRNPWCGYEAVVSVVQTASAVPSSDSPGGSGVE